MLRPTLLAATGVLLIFAYPGVLTSIACLRDANVFSFGFGCITTLILLRIPSIVKSLLKGSAKQERDSQIYGLEHGILNLPAKPATWWMNMGYWKDQTVPNSLPEACHALLLEVLTTAGLLQSSASITRSITPDPLIENVYILDVGFGCGDQTLALKTLSRTISYVGVTLDKQQFNFAKCRGIEKLPKDTDDRSIRLFQGDAAVPEIWPASLKEAVKVISSASPQPEDGSNHLKWVLALDTLYHFKPSRRPLFEYAYQHLHASIMAFDLFLSDQPHSLIQGLLLRASCLVSSTPYGNLLRTSQYRHLLESVGYNNKDITIVDITEHVFTPLAEFLEYQDRELKFLGLSIGRFRAAKWLFSWWGRTGIVRGCIVVAKR